MHEHLQSVTIIQIRMFPFYKSTLIRMWIFDVEIQMNIILYHYLLITMTLVLLAYKRIFKCLGIRQTISICIKADSVKRIQNVF